jgi:hypothetical protein
MFGVLPAPREGKDSPRIAFKQGSAGHRTPSKEEGRTLNRQSRFALSVPQCLIKHLEADSAKTATCPLLLEKTVTQSPSPGPAISPILPPVQGYGLPEDDELDPAPSPRGVMPIIAQLSQTQPPPLSPTLARKRKQHPRLRWPKLAPQSAMRSDMMGSMEPIIEQEEGTLILPPATARGAHHRRGNTPMSTGTSRAVLPRALCMWSGLQVRYLLPTTLMRKS